MDTAEDADAYDAIDNGEVNALYCRDLLAVEPRPRRVADIGTGTALLAIELCRQSSECTVVATDLAEHMLERARRNVAAASLGHRIELLRVDAKGSSLPRDAFDVVMSNSLIHHIESTASALSDMLEILAPGGLLFVRDLARPESDQAVRDILAQHAATDTPMQRALFDASLRAALTLDEIRAAASSFGIPAEAVQMSSNRHWTIAYRSAR